MKASLTNPFRPGAGHKPPYLAGRSDEKREFKRVISQGIILDNLILTGLRGVGKTVLLDEFKNIAQENGWQWAGTDCSESASVTEQTIAIRLLTDIALVTSNIQIGERQIREIGFNGSSYSEPVYMDFNFLCQEFENIPGLTADKLKRLLLGVWNILKGIDGFNGIVFAYDEAQTLSDHAENQQYPLSVLLDLFQDLQKNGVRFILLLTGLPTLMTKLIEARTYSERLFRVLVLNQLTEDESRQAILKPLNGTKFNTKFDEDTVNLIIKTSGGYPYFIQYICRDIFDSFENTSQEWKPEMLMDTIVKKLDSDFFTGRWSKASDRERELMIILARSGTQEFSVQDASKLSEESEFANFSGSLANQMFAKLIDKGLLYKDRRGVYLFAVPLLGQFIRRTYPKK